MQEGKREIYKIEWGKKIYIFFLDYEDHHLRFIYQIKKKETGDINTYGAQNDLRKNYRVNFTL